jgi:serine/threonine protein kinase
MNLDKDYDDLFEPLGIIGRGTYGEVIKCRNKSTGVIYAMKAIKGVKEEIFIDGIPENALREKDVFENIKHPNILEGHYYKKQKNYNLFLFEYFKSDLNAFRREFNDFKLPIDIIRGLIFDVANGLKCMHDNKYVHRDIKPDNILIKNISDKGGKKSLKAVICDFGFSRQCYSNQKMTPNLVTICYRSPNILCGDENYSFPCDIWSLGCVIAELLTGEILFRGLGEIDTLFKIFDLLGVPKSNKWCSHLKYQFYSDSDDFGDFKSKFKGYDKLVVDLISKMLKFNPNERITIDEVIKHKFFKK